MMIFRPILKFSAGEAYRRSASFRLLPRSIAVGGVLGILYVLMPSVYAATESNDEEDNVIQIEADSVEYNPSDGSSVYIGNVVIDRGDIHLTGDKVEVTTVDEKNRKIVVEGSPATCRTYVNEQNLARIKANRIVYEESEQMMNLYRDARLDYEGRTLRGEHIVYDLETNLIRVPKGRKRVRLTLPPEDFN